MRKWQKEYFKTRSPLAFNEAKKMEKLVDQLLEEMETPSLFQKDDPNIMTGMINKDSGVEFR